MEQTLYGDILFLVNFTMDFLTLFITASILKRKVSTLRLSLSSSLGAIYGVVACFMTAGTLIYIVLNVAISFLMCYIAFSKKILPPTCLFYGVGCLLGGAMTALYGVFSDISGPNTVYSDGSYRTLSAEIPPGWMAAIAVLIGTAAILGGRYCKRARTLDCEVILTTSEGEFALTGMNDSGNLLTEPISGRAVIIVKKDKFLSLIPSELSSFYNSGSTEALAELPPELLGTVRILPSSSVGGEKLLFGYVPLAVTVDGVKRNVIIAMGDNEGFNGHDALVPIF